MTTFLTVGFIFNIMDAYSAYVYLLMQSTGIVLNLENKRIPDSTASNLFVVSTFDVIIIIIQQINLPFNIPNIHNYSGYFLDKIHTDIVGGRLSNPPTSNSFWSVFILLF